MRTSWDPQVIDYLTYLAWARFCAAPDKEAVLAKSREAFLYASEALADAGPRWFFLARAERMAGHDRDALRHFHEVLAIESEARRGRGRIRILEARLAR